MTTKLKICGLTDPAVAAKATSLGVDYIGLIFHPKSSRHIELDLAASISDAVHDVGGCIVPVFVDQDADTILATAKAIQADYIQLHGSTAAAAYPHLGDYSCVVANQFSKALALRPEKDFKLYDYHEPGSGKTFDWDNANLDPDFRSFIAGGIDVNNIGDVVSLLKPYAIDISSGVETSPGIKELALIEACIKKLTSVTTDV